MHIIQVIALAIFILLPNVTQTGNLISTAKELTGEIIYVGPTPRLMYEFSVEDWNSLGIELQLKQIRLDSLCYTDSWLKGSRRYYKLKMWKEKIKNGTKESYTWGIQPWDTITNYPVFWDNPLLSNYGMGWRAWKKGSN